MSQSSVQRPGIRVPYDTLRRSVEEAFVRVGVPAPIAAVEATLAADADLMGTASHGVRMLPRVLKAISSGMIKANPTLTLVRDFAATCVLDGDCGPGRFVALTGMNHAIERAKKFGVGICVARNTCHWGRGHAYAYHAANEGFIGLCTTNALVSILAFGSEERLLANNPLAIGAPQGPGRPPVVLDMAMSQAALGKIETYRRAGKKVPLDWGLDSAGNPTDDPAAILQSKKILPTGGHKGAGLALMMEVLTSCLAGGLLAQGLASKEASAADAFTSKFFLAIHPAALGEQAEFTQRVDEMIDYIHAAGTPEKPLLYPGERGWKEREVNLVQGVPIDGQTAQDLEAAGLRF